jgi:hypothetical protein
VATATFQGPGASHPLLDHTELRRDGHRQADAAPRRDGRHDAGHRGPVCPGVDRPEGSAALADWPHPAPVVEVVLVERPFDHPVR